jgi:hypothetical protein
MCFIAPTLACCARRCQPATAPTAPRVSPCRFLVVKVAVNRLVVIPVGTLQRSEDHAVLVKTGSELASRSNRCPNPEPSMPFRLQQRTWSSRSAPRRTIASAVTCSSAVDHRCAFFDRRSDPLTGTEPCGAVDQPCGLASEVFIDRMHLADPLVAGLGILRLAIPNAPLQQFYIGNDRRLRRDPVSRVGRQICRRQLRVIGIGHQFRFQPTAAPIPSAKPQPVTYPTTRIACVMIRQCLDSPCVAMICAKDRSRL